MNGNLLELTIRRIALVSLVALVGFGAWRLATQEKDAFADPALRDQLLAARMDEYIAMRKANDQVALYGMMDPEQRAIKTLPEYLKFHDLDVLKIIEMTWADPRVDVETGTARVRLDSTVELQPSKLPPPFNKLQEEHEEHLRQSSSEELDLVWRKAEGDWFLRMDRTFVTGKSPDGRQIQSLGEKLAK